MVELVAEPAHLALEGNIVAEYQNIFTSIQIRGPAYVGVPLRGEDSTCWLR